MIQHYGDSANGDSPLTVENFCITPVGVNNRIVEVLEQGVKYIQS